MTEPRADSNEQGSSSGIPSPPHDHGPSDAHSQHTQSNEGLSKLKRTACVLCRKRKLRCDGIRPKCGTCSRLGHDCKYDEVRKKSGPKRGYVKALEQRLAQVETMLKTDDGVVGQGSSSENVAASTGDFSTMGLANPTDMSSIEHPEVAKMNAMATSAPFDNGETEYSTTSGMGGTAEPAPQLMDESTFDMVALGLEEPLPIPEDCDELNELFFTKVYPTMPLIHKARYYAAMDLPPHMRPPVCMRYAMWALAAGTSDKHDQLSEHFYHRARKYLELDEMKGFGQAMLTLAHCQAWFLMAMYEFKNMFFPRAWMSTGRAIRLTQMLSLHRLDGASLDVKMTIVPPRDWTEKEERRRTFWLVYWADRCASIGTGWPMSFEEKDILTNLPAPDENFQHNQEVQTSTLEESLHRLDKTFTSLSGSVLMATLFGRNLTHLHRPEPDDNDSDLNGRFWQRHRSLDAILLNIKLTMPDHLRMPFGVQDTNAVFLNMCLHASAICLHQAAIFKAEKHRVAANVASESKMRCIAAASEIATIMRTASHIDLAQMNPFTAFCLYVAARVHVQFLRARPDDQRVSSSLQFLVTAMHAMAKRNPLTKSFIAQLELDMEAAKVQNPVGNGALQDLIDRGVPEYSMKNSRKSQGKGVAALDTDFGENGSERANNAYESSRGSSNGPTSNSPSLNLPMHPNVRLDENSSNHRIGKHHVPVSHLHSHGVFPESMIDANERQDQLQSNPDSMDLSTDASGSMGSPADPQQQKRQQSHNVPTDQYGSGVSTFLGTSDNNAYMSNQASILGGSPSDGGSAAAPATSSNEGTMDSMGTSSSPRGTAYAFAAMDVPGHFESSSFLSRQQLEQQRGQNPACPYGLANTSLSLDDFAANYTNIDLPNITGFGDGSDAGSFGVAGMQQPPGTPANRQAQQQQQQQQQTAGQMRGGERNAAFATSVPDNHADMFSDPSFPTQIPGVDSEGIAYSEQWQMVLDSMTSWDGGEPLIQH